MADVGPLLPELARSLRVLGTPRDAGAEAAHAAVFGPLLGARARASRGDANAALAALKGEALSARIAALVGSAATGGLVEPARGRARAAEARELLNPLMEAFRELDRIAVEIPLAAATESPAWSRWVEQLRRVFAAADEACGALGRLLAEEAEPPRRRGWFGGSGDAR